MARLDLFVCEHLGVQLIRLTTRTGIFIVSMDDYCGQYSYKSCSACNLPVCEGSV